MLGISHLEQESSIKPQARQEKLCRRDAQKMLYQDGNACAAKIQWDKNLKHEENNGNREEL
ncbi:MAG: hypothetical protein LIO78_08465 [Clostridiales bacterium]|nr:hypothetical protein [Clostridiales bacterium]